MVCFSFLYLSFHFDGHLGFLCFSIFLPFQSWCLLLLFIHSPCLENNWGTSLVAQWIRICLPMQGTRVRSLVWEDPACHGASKSMCHNYWVCALEPVSHNYSARVPQLLKPTHLEPMLLNKRSHHNEKPVHRNKELPLLTRTRESPRAAMKTQCNQK